MPYPQLKAAAVSTVMSQASAALRSCHPMVGYRIIGHAVKFTRYDAFAVNTGFRPVQQCQLRLVIGFTTSLLASFYTASICPVVSWYVKEFPIKRRIYYAQYVLQFCSPIREQQFFDPLLQCEPWCRPIQFGTKHLPRRRILRPSCNPLK